MYFCYLKCRCLYVDSTVRRCLYDTNLFYNKLTAQIPNIIVENG